MNSIQDLNNYGGTTITFNDQRDPGIIINPNPPQNQSTTVYERTSHAVPVGAELLEVIGYATSQPYYVVNVAAVANANVTWTTIPSGMTVSNSSGVYRIGPIASNQYWDIIKSPNVAIPASQIDNFTYTAGFNWANIGNVQQSSLWTVSVSVIDDYRLTGASNATYGLVGSNLITGTPQVEDTGNITPTYTLTITPSNTGIIANLSTSGSGGTSSFNGTSKVLTITGTKTQINSRLLTLTANINSASQVFTFTYYLTNATNSDTSTRVQIVEWDSEDYMSYTRGATYYIEDTQANISLAPTITDSYSGSNLYTLNVSPTISSTVSNIWVYNGNVTQSFNGTSKMLTLTGTKSNLNAVLTPTGITTLRLTPTTNETSTINLIYNLTTPNGNVANRRQDVICSLVDGEVTNITAARSYTANTSNSIFTVSTPQIDDGGSSSTTVYTIYLSSSIGYFARNNIDLSNNWNYTGTKSEINALFDEIKFYPLKDSFTSGTFTYQQWRDSVKQLEQTVGITGNAGSFTANTITTWTSSASYVPLAEQYLYGHADILIVGAGGRGSAMAGGGGGGEVRYIQDHQLSLTTYGITVGICAAPEPDNYGRSSAFGYTADQGSWSSSGTGGDALYSAYNPPWSVDPKTANISLNQTIAGISPAPSTITIETNFGGTASGAGYKGGGGSGSLGLDYANFYGSEYEKFPGHGRDSSGNVGGQGGLGVYIPITSQYYGAGGGGFGNTTGGQGGSNVGGQGDSWSAFGSSPIANTGSGGGGYFGLSGSGRNSIHQGYGANGVVAIKWKYRG